VKINPYRLAIMMAASFLLVGALAFGEQPECTGDRHYDGVACCPVESTTTTTLPEVEPRACPDPGPCPSVVCDCTGTCEGSPVSVTINRCPDVTFPAYAPCRERKPGVVRDGDVIFGGKAYKCPRRGTPRRYFIPQSAR
jgi:hypothetical protein